MTAQSKVKFDDRINGTTWSAFGSVFLLIAVAAGCHTFSWNIPSLMNWSPEVAANMMAGSGAVAAIFFGLSQWMANQATARSKQNLDAACEGIRRAYDVLTGDKPERSFAWVNAARLILRSLDLADRLTEEDHTRAWKLFREEWRIRFVSFLSADLPYYFGVGEWTPATKINVTPQLISSLAKQSWAERELEIEGLHASISDTRMLSERALRAIFNLVTMYDPNDEPLDKIEDFDKATKDALLRRDHYGAYAYLELTERFTFIGGEALRNEGIDPQ